MTTRNEISKSDSRGGGRSRMRRVLNSRLLAGTIALAAIAGPAVYFWHWFQVRRTAAAMLERAEELVEDEDFDAAAQYYYRYLRIRPDDAQVQILLAETFDRAAASPIRKVRAVELYYQALGVAPADRQPALRRRVAELQLELAELEGSVRAEKRQQRLALAEEEARTLLGLDGDDPEAWRLLARALYAQFRAGGAAARRADPAAVGDALQRAVQLNPGDAELAVVLAVVYRSEPQLLGDEMQALGQAERQQLADQVVDEMVQANPKSAKAHLARYRYRMGFQLPGAKEDLATALSLAPDDVGVLLVAAYHARHDAQSARRDGRADDAQTCYAEARKHYEHVIQVARAEEAAYLGLGEVHAEQGKNERAIETWRLGLASAHKESVQLNLRLGEALIAQGELAEAENVLNVLGTTAEKLGAGVLAPASKLALERTIHLLRAKWLLRKGQPLDAIPLLRRVAIAQRSAGADIAQGMQAWQLLASVYATLGQWDQVATAYEQASALEPKLPQLRVQAAAAWAAAGRPDVAIAGYEQALAIDPAPDTWLALAGAELQRQARTPKTERDWGRFHKALAEVKRIQGEKPPADGWRTKLLEAECLVLRGEEQGDRERAVREALELLRSAEKEDAAAPGLLQSLAAAYERLDQPTDADRVLERLAATEGQAVTARLMQARLYANRKKYDEARRVLTAGLEKLPKESRPALERELIQLEVREGRLDQARAALEKLHGEAPSNLAVLLQLADLAFEKGDLDDVERREKKLRELEGPDGVYWQYYEIRRLLAQATGPDDPRLTRAAELHARIHSQRPSWPETYFLQGMWLESRGQLDQAAAAYQEAIRLGSRQLAAYERLVSLLLHLDRAAEADRYLLLLQDQIASSENLSSLEMSVAAQRGQTQRAVDIARRRVEQRPQDAIAHLWLGQILLTTGKVQEAETELRRAAELAPGDARTLGGLFGYFARTRQTDRARETLQELSKNEKLTAAQRASVLAQGSELLGDREQAAAHYREAARLAPDDAAPKLQLAEFLLRTHADVDSAEAERVLRGILEQSPASGPARRLLAELLMERGGEKEWDEARKLVEQGGADRASLGIDRRMQAMILARRGGKENLEKARQILEELVIDPKRAAAIDRLALARVYEIVGRPDSARQQYARLAAADNPRPGHLAAYVEFLLRQEAQDQKQVEADKWLKRLEEVRPDDLGVMRLRARWLRSQDRAAEIEPAVESLAEKIRQKPWEGPDDERKQREAQLAFEVGSVYSAVEQQTAAERWYRRLVQLDPRRYEPLADCLSRQGQMQEAFRVCREAARADSSSRPAMVLAAALYSGKPTTTDFQLAEPVLTEAAAGHKDDVDLLLALANVRVVQGKADEAVKLYRQVLSLRPNHVLAMNNLATLLSEQSAKRQEALAYIDRAIRLVGPQPGLLDTKGMLLVHDGKPEEAVPLLEEASSMPNPDPRCQFHLAVAYERAGAAEKARAALAAARKGDLDKQILTEMDRQMLAELEKKLQP